VRGFGGSGGGLVGFDGVEGDRVAEFVEGGDGPASFPFGFAAQEVVGAEVVVVGVARYAAGEAVLRARALVFSCSYSVALIAPESSSAFADAISSVAVPFPPFGVATDLM